MVTLRDITPDNWEECIALSVDESQSGFVATNMFSLAQAKVFPACMPVAIYADDAMVGFAMYGIDEDGGEMWISRLMIDRAHQRKGYGRAAMRLLLDRIKQETSRRTILLSYEPENAGAEALYRSLGFESTGQIIQGEAVLKLTLAQG